MVTVTMFNMFNVLQKQPDHSALLTQCFSWMSLDVSCLVDLRLGGLGLCERASCPFCLKHCRKDLSRLSMKLKLIGN